MTRYLVRDVGAANVLATDLSDPEIDFGCQYENLDITDYARFETLVKRHNITQIVHEAAVISSIGELKP